MPSLTLSERLIWFAHCPKAGGTSVEKMMISLEAGDVGHLHWGWDLWWRRGGWARANPPNSPQHLTWEDARAMLPRAPDAVFALVREPARRMQSEHRWQRHARRGTLLGKALAWLPFSFWIRVMLALARQHPYALDNHLRPQSDFIPEGARIFRLEDGLAPVARWLEEATGHAVPGTPPHILKSAGSTRGLRESDRARIVEAFGVDYRRFGYPFTCGPAARRDMADRLADRLAPYLAWLDRRGLI